MKITKRILCLILTLLMLLPLIVACNKSDEDDANETENQLPVSTEDVIETDQYGQPIYSDPTEGLDFGGKTVNFLIRSGSQYLREWYSAEPANNVEQQIYTRNMTVEDALDVKLNFIVQAEGDLNKDFYDKVVNTASAGLGGIDVVSGFAAYHTNKNALPFYMNWFDEETLPYLNLDRKYWNQNYIRDAAAFDKLYVCVGDMNLSLYDRCMVVFFNKEKVKQYIKDSSDNPINLYELVQSGNWYYDTFYGMIKDVYEDSGAIENERGYDDFYGVTGIKGSEASDAFLYSLGGSLTATSPDDGSHSLVTDTQFVRLSNIFSAMTDFWYSNGAILPTETMTNYEIFSGGHALFTVDVVWHHETGFQKIQNMSDGYGIIPMPKFDENQESYITGVQDAYNVLSILRSGPDQDFKMISAVLEKMAYESYSGVRPYYVENILMTRNMDFDSAMCFNYVLDGIRWDFADVYCTGIGWLRNGMWRDIFQANMSFDTAWNDARMKSYNKKIKDFDAWLLSQN